MKPSYRFELKLPEVKSKEYKALRRWMVRKGYALPRSPLKSIKEEYLIEYLKEYQNERNMAIIKAPFTEEQVHNLNKWQRDRRVHPFTCSTKEKHNHPDEESTILIATSNGWVCPRCDYKQDWAHDFMALPSNQLGELVGAFPEFPEMDTEETRRFLRTEEYDPDELAAEGVNLVREISLIAKIKNAINNKGNSKRMHQILDEIKALINEHEEKKKSKNSPTHNKREATDNDV